MGCPDNGPLGPARSGPEDRGPSVRRSRGREILQGVGREGRRHFLTAGGVGSLPAGVSTNRPPPPPSPRRSEEGRVGEEGRSRWAPDHLKKKKKETVESDSHAMRAEGSHVWLPLVSGSIKMRGGNTDFLLAIFDDATPQPTSPHPVMSKLDW